MQKNNSMSEEEKMEKKSEEEKCALIISEKMVRRENWQLRRMKIHQQGKWRKWKKINASDGKYNRSKRIENKSEEEQCALLIITGKWKEEKIGNYEERNYTSTEKTENRKEDKSTNAKRNGNRPEKNIKGGKYLTKGRVNKEKENARDEKYTGWKNDKENEEKFIIVL